MNSPMNISPEEWELIDSFLENNDFPDELAILNNGLTSIPNIKEKIEYIKTINEEIEDCIRKSKIKEFHNQVPNSTGSAQSKIVSFSKFNNRTIWYSIAASIAVIIGIFWLFKTNDAPEKLFAKHFKPDIGLPLKMSPTNDYDFYEGMVDYKQENYREAITKWEILWMDNPESDTLNYFLGVAHLALGNAVQSLKYLENQNRFQTSIFKDEANYYAALANIKKGNYEAAKSLLENNPTVRNSNLLIELNNQ
jgi:hypothetical protein